MSRHNSRRALFFPPHLEPFEQLKIIRIKLVKGFIVEPILAAKFSYPLFVVYLGVH